MKNADMPAAAFQEVQGITGGMVTKYRNHQGLTKREQACITLGLPETGDEDLDALIRKSERKRIAAIAMQGLLSNIPPKDHTISDGTLVKTASWLSSEILKELEK